MFHEVFTLRALERTTPLETCQWRVVQQDVVRLHVSLQRSALGKALTAGGTKEALTVRALLCLIWMHAGDVATDRILLHGGIFAQVTVVGLLTGLPESVKAKLAPAGEETAAGGTLEIWVGEMQTKVLLQVGVHLEAATTFGAGVGAIDVLGSLSKVL